MDNKTYIGSALRGGSSAFYKAPMAATLPTGRDGYTLSVGREAKTEIPRIRPCLYVVHGNVFAWQGVSAALWR
jgi:hypothetical protein